MDVYYQHFGKLKREGYYEYSRNTLSRFPLSIIDKKNIELIKQIESYSKQLNESVQKFKKAKTDKDKTFERNKCQSLDDQIDKLVYEVYGLSKEDIINIEDN